jgi:uncharacterized membrane protein
MAIVASLHLLAAVIWVGGMFFAHQCLRPVAAAQLPPPQRLQLWAGVFSRFFPWVWGAVISLLASGLWLLLTVFGGFAGAAVHLQVMLVLGLVMSGIFGYLFFRPYAGLNAAVAAGDWPAGAAQLARIRRLVGINLTLGLITLVAAAAGRWPLPF